MAGTKQTEEERKQQLLKEFYANRTELDEIIDQLCDDAHYDRFDEIDRDVQRLKQLFWKSITEVFLDDKTPQLVLEKLKTLKKKIVAL